MWRHLGTLLLAVLVWAASLHVGWCDPTVPAKQTPAAATETQAPAEDAAAEDGDAEATPAEAEVEPAADKDDAAKKHKYIRIARDENEKPTALETSIVTFAPTGDKHQGVTIELVGAVHVGDPEYYAQLNKTFESYDVLLYELVAPEGTRIPKGGRKETKGAIGALQGGMSSLLELEHQLSKIDYTKKNFVHADMTPEEFAKSMTDRGESFLQIFLRALGQSAAMQGTGKQQISDADIFMALLAKDRSLRLKRLLAQQFEDMESSISIFEGPEGSTLITERNKKCFEVLAKELKNGHKRIGVFYGAGHLADMEQRLNDEFQMERTGEKWLAAWDLKGKSKPNVEEEPAPKPDDADAPEDDRCPFDNSDN